MIQPPRFRVSAFLAALGGLAAAVALSGAEVGYPIVARFAGPDVSTNGTVWSSVQSADGVMHFGARSFVTFDGERWQSTPMDSGYAVRGLDIAPDGRIWATGVGEIGWFDQENGAWKYHSLLSRLPPEHRSPVEGWHAYAEGTGAVFVTNTKILRWDGSSFKVWTKPNPRHLRGLRAGSRIFVQHKETGLYEMTPAGPELFLSVDVIGDAGLFLLEQAGADWIWVSSAGLFRWSGGKPQLVAGAASEYIKQHSLTVARRLPDGRIGLGSVDDGIVFITADGRIDGVLDQASGVGEHYITSLLVDRDNGLWATSRSAVFRISIGSASTLFDARSGLPQKQISKITSHRGRIALLTDESLYELEADQKTLTRTALVGGPFTEAQDSPEGLLVGGYRKLVRLADGGSRTVFQSDQDVVMLSHRSDGRVLIGEANRVVEMSADGNSRTIVQGLPDYATSVAEDAEHNLWIGTIASGVFVASPRDDAAVTAVPAADVSSLPAGKGFALVAVAPTGAVLVIKPTGGWIRRAVGAPFERIENLPLQTIAAVAPEFDRAGNLWAVTMATESQPATLGRIVLREGQAAWQPHSAEGLPQIGSPRCIFVEERPNQDVALWVGGTLGVLRTMVFNQEAIAPQPRAPLLLASARTALHGAAEPIVRTLPYSTRAIEFQFAEPDFARRSMLRLETRIDGLDHNWVRTGPEARRELMAVRDGNYTMQVRAVAETGVASAPTVFAFTVAPPWWRTLPALLGVVFALAPLAYGVYRLRLHALRHRTIELEAKVRQRTEQLEQASAAKTVFVANMSHDIRNPLNGIVGLALALEDTRLDPKQREIVATLRECTTYLSSLVDDVLDFASIEAGRVELRPGPFVPAELLRSIVTTLKADTAESGARLHIDVDPRLPANLSGDAGRIQQILVNYVSNALKYAGGEIHLAATIPAGSPDEVEFAVTDGGPGISAADQATLFTKFTRLTSAREHEIPGAGLGLASCRLLADIMSGSVGVESHPGRGARFYLRLPLTPALAPVAPETGDLPNTTVLLVEDTDYNAMAASAVLRRLGLTCERARTGAEALEMFAAKRFNLVLLDRNLPDMDGTEIARQMRERESTDGLRSIILAVTAYCTAEDRKLCLDAGMDAFVGKPLTPEKMRKVLLAAGRRMLAAATFDATPAPEAPAAAPLDTSLLDYLGDGTDSGLAGQIDRFLTGLSDAQSQLGRANTDRDFSTLATTAHRLLGQARMVGGGTLGDAALALEQAADRCDADACDDLLRQVTGEIRTITAALRHRRSGALTS